MVEIWKIHKFMRTHPNMLRAVSFLKPSMYCHKAMISCLCFAMNLVSDSCIFHVMYVKGMQSDPLAIYYIIESFMLISEYTKN